MSQPTNDGTQGSLYRAFLGIVLATLAAITSAGAQRPPLPASPAGVPLRHTEGTVHGFLRLSTAAGRLLADGDLLQAVRHDTIDSRMVFTFPDSSVFEESVSFTQHVVFEMVQYHLVQRGPAFTTDLDVTLARTGAYHVIARAHADGAKKEYTGKLDLPADTYNGMIINVAKNLPLGTTRAVHLVAFTPKPRLIDLRMTGAASPAPTLLGQRTERTVVFTLKPHIGGVTGVLARLLGKMPADSRAWFVTQDVPAFVRFEGPLYLGPVWRIDLVGPTLPAEAPSSTSR